MPKSKNPSSYPKEYFAIINAVVDGGETLHIPCDRKRAQWLRHDFHAFGAALRKHSVPDGYRLQQTILTVSDEGLTIEPRSNLLRGLNLPTAEPAPASEEPAGALPADLSSTIAQVLGTGQPPKAGPEDGEK